MAILSRNVILSGLHAASLLRAGQLPTEAEISAAPTLEAWGLERLEGGLCRLVGMVVGHPSLADGFCRTSVLLVMAEDYTWARTVSRLYALGPSIHDLLDEASSEGRQ